MVHPESSFGDISPCFNGFANSLANSSLSFRLRDLSVSWDWIIAFGFLLPSPFHLLFVLLFPRPPLLPPLFLLPCPRSAPLPRLFLLRKSLIQDGVTAMQYLSTHLWIIFVKSTVSKFILDGSPSAQDATNRWNLEWTSDRNHVPKSSYIVKRPTQSFTFDKNELLIWIKDVQI